MRCEAIDCIHNAHGYCVDSDYVTIDHAGECTQKEFYSSEQLCDAWCPNNPSFTEYGWLDMIVVMTRFYETNPEEFCKLVGPLDEILKEANTKHMESPEYCCTDRR